jgi:hypothetical protein
VGVWLVVFCPFFFSSDKLVYLQERADGDPKTPAQIGGLDTYERAIVHEFMHVGMFSYRNKSELFTPRFRSISNSCSR